MRQDIKHVAVIGAGTIGASWAAYFLSRGLSVTASDPSPGAPDLIRRMVENAWPILMRLGGKPDPTPMPGALKQTPPPPWRGLISCRKARRNGWM